MFDHFGPHHVSTADDERISEIEQAFEVVRGGQLHRLFGLNITRLSTFNVPEAGRCATFGTGNSAKFWRLSAQTVLEVARLVFFLTFLCL